MTKTLLAFSFVLMIAGCRGCVGKVSDELMLPDQNPQLISYLQGDWANSNDSNTVLRINRDSIITISNNLIKSTNNLRYSFDEPAGKYFTKDSSFDFYSVNEKSLSTNNFKLVETDKNLPDPVIYTLAFVSKNRLEMSLQGKALSLRRVKEALR